ncbi:MAG: hypothetical protein R3F56_11755 [Planctomycetota bacterium]
MNPRTLGVAFGVVLLACLRPLPAQELRVAIDQAPVIVVGQHRGVRPRGDDFLVHRVAVLRTLRGDVATEVNVLEWKKLSFHQRPALAAIRIYCLHPVDDAEQLGLPAGRYYRMDAHPGSHAPVGTTTVEGRPRIEDGDPVVRLAALLLEAQRDGSIAGRKADLLDLALRTPSPVRVEAARLLVERAPLLDGLNPVELASLLARATAETEDVEYKLALATVCAERRMPDVVEGLCIAWPQIDDENFSRAIGRFAKHLHGEAATAQLLPYLQRARDPKLRGHVLLAIGATSTDSALEALLRARPLEGDKTAVDAALRLHGAPRAIEAAGKR